MINKTLIIIFYLSLTTSFAQRDTLYSLSADIGIGYSNYLTTLEFQDLNKHGFTGTLKVMWHPEHLLSLGIETGYINLYSIKSDVSSEEFGFSELKASMVSIPLMFVSSMCIFPLTLPDLEIHGGGGVHFMFNNGELYGRSIYSSVFSFGYHLGATYLVPLSSDSSIGIEIKYYYISKLKDSDIAFKVLFSYDFLEW